MNDLTGHPKLGASWEGFITEQLVSTLNTRDPTFWRTQAGAELDLRIEHRGSTIGVEVKRTARPAMTRSIHSALADLELDHLIIAHAGRSRFPLHHKVTAIPAIELVVDPDSAIPDQPNLRPPTTVSPNWRLSSEYLQAAYPLGTGVGGDVGQVPIALSYIKPVADDEGGWNLKTDIVQLVVRSLLSFTDQ